MYNEMEQNIQKCNEMIVISFNNIVEHLENTCFRRRKNNDSNN